MLDLYVNLDFVDSIKILSRISFTKIFPFYALFKYQAKKFGTYIKKNTYNSIFLKYINKNYFLHS